MTKEEIQRNSEHWYNKYKDAEKYIAELEAQIEKMKCCMNCKYFDRNEPKYCNKGVFNSYVCNKWELAK